MNRAELKQITMHDLGAMAYEEALAMQRALQHQVIAARDVQCDTGEAHIGHLLLVEHDPPVITISRRQSAAGHLLATPLQLRAAGVEVARTDRGGDITYHGPGQLVVYPVLDLNMLGLRMHSYMRFLEQIVIDVLSSFGLTAQRDEQATGVWVQPPAAHQSEMTPKATGPGPANQPTELRQTQEPAPGTQRQHPADGPPHPRSDAKIAAMGVRVSRWVSMHGLALNVRTNLEHFKLIVPCGLHGRSVTSMLEQLGEPACPDMYEVKARLCAVFERAVRAAADHTARQRRAAGSCAACEDVNPEQVRA